MNAGRRSGASLEAAAWRQAALALPALDLPADRPARPGAADVPAAARARRPTEAAAAATPRQALAAWAALVHRLTGAPRFALAAGGALADPGARAPASADDGTAVPVEVVAGDDPGFAAFAERLAAALVDPARPRLAWDELAAAVSPDAPGEPPIVRVAFLALQGDGGRDDGDATAVTPTGCDLTLGWSPGGPWRLAYAPDLFDAASAGRLLARFETLLAAALAAPETPLSRLDVLPADERATLLAWGTGPALPPGAGGADAGQRLERLFAARAARQPDAPALAAGGTLWSYRELARRSGEVAARLRRRGLAPGARVGVLAERRPELVAALLGTLEAGCAYVPLDPRYPADRLAFMLADSGAGAVLAHRHLLPVLPPGAPPALVLCEDDGEGAGDAAAAPPAAGAPPDAGRLAYVIYTSGSTGRPKGVAIEHKSAAALLAWAAGELSAAELSGVAAVTSVCFDLSIFEIFLPLAAGGTVVLFDDALAVAHHRGEPPVTLLNTVPSAAAELARLGAIPPSATTIALAGEPLRRDLVERLYALPHVRRVLDLYGPSEDTTYSTGAEVERGAGRPVTIGRPIGGTRAVLVDRRLRPVGIGVPGELCLAGAGLARGYLGRPALTAAAFVPDPFAAAMGGAAGDRLYRTGDLARWLPDGRLDFLGRLDHQVKVRGFRIELGEIETALSRHPGVGEAVVVVHRPGVGGAGGGEPGDALLVAYWAADAGHARTEGAVDEGELREALRRTLPDYMVPGLWLRLDALPRNPNGKVDRKALPAPAARRRAAAAGRAAGAGTEAAVAAIWRDLLALDDLGADDDLFVLGGHSLVATRIAARVREELGVALPPADLFEHSTVARLAARIDQLAAGGPGAGGAAAEPPPVTRARRDRPLPLAFPQEQVWLIHRLDRENLAYNFQYTVRFRGPLDHAVLERALSEIVRRHESLRTTFPAVDGEPAQVIHPPWPARVPRVDLTALPPGRREAAAERLVRRLVRRSFDVTRLPLLEWTSIAVDRDDHLFVQAEQHFVHDGWSIGVFLGELEALYPAFRDGRPSPLPELPVQYADFAAWQREWMRGAALEEQLSYWRRQLADPPPPLELPADRPRGRRQSFRGDRLDADVPPALYARLRALGRREGWTLFMLMTAAFEALVARLSGRTDFLLGSGVANRRRREIEPLIGMVVNTLVLRADVAGQPTFRELVGRVRQAALGLQAWQDLPFEALVAELQPERDLSRNPLFQHMFSFHDAPVPDLDFGGGLAGDLVERHNGSAKADWNVIVKPRGAQRLGRAPRDEDQVLRVLWEFATDLFDRVTIERTWGSYLVLLEALADDPDLRVARAPLLGAAERRQLAAWNDTAAPLPDLDLAREVAARAAERPEAPAVVAGEGAARTVLTYGGLAAAAGRLAARLRAAGVGPETVVAVALPSSPEWVTALVAVLGAGGAYLPLDPEHPAERLAYTLADSGARVLLTAAGAERALPAFDGRVLAVGGTAAGEGGAGAAGRLQPPPLAPDHLAYVIYTSGSTGRPKGTGLTRRGLANLVAWHLAAYRLDGASRTTLVASPAFDASVWELWPTLAAGGAVHVPPPELRAAPRALGRWLAAEGITSSFLPTPLAEALLEEGLPDGLALGELLVGGDRLHRPAPAGLPCRLVNHYGPTEDTVVSTAGEVAARPERGLAAPPIGRPIANTRVHVVDRRLEPLPVGVPGELAVAGDGLARGYLGRPALTAERFVPDPFAAAPGGRLYRTGDLVRRLPDGRIDFLGRLDHQVKVRGFRVELGEIEALLAEHPAVRRAAVVPVEAAAADGGGAAGLAAFVVAAPGREAPPDGELRAHLAARLPSYMVPETLTALAALPLSPTGKVDRRALAERAARRAAAGGEGAAAARRAAPRDPGERLVAEIWAEVLGLPAGTPLGVHDDFFALGGHSLRAAKAAARVGDAFGVDLELPDLFENPTIARLAAHVGERLAGGERAEPIPRLGAAEKAAGVPLSFAQERLWLIDQLIARRSTYHVARAWVCRGPLDPAALAAALATVVARHEALRTALVDRGGGPVQRVAEAAEAAPALPLRDLAALPAARRAEAEGRLLRRLVEAPFDLGRAPLVRAALLRRAPEEHVLALVLHHLAADGWSMPRLAAEIGEAYRARLAGEAPDLPALPVQYADFAVWQRRRLAGRPLERLAAFWREQLHDAPRTLALPADRPPRAERSLAGGRVQARLDAAAVEPLRRLAREMRATLFMALLAGLAALLGRLGRQDDVVIGTPVAGRGRREVEDLIGFFVNTLALRVRLGRGPDGRPPGFAALLDRVRRATLAAYAHQEMPFERLVELLAPERDLGQSPLFQVTLALEAGGEQSPALAGCVVRPEPVPRREAHFELTLFAGERADGGLDLAFTYDADLFDAATVERLASRLGRLLAAACEDPERPVARLPLVDAAERRQLVAAAPRAAAGLHAGGETLAARLAERARRDPSAPALVADDLVLTWGELAAHAGRLADGLAAAVPLSPEAPVAVCLDRSPELVVAQLAVLAAGAACQPLDAGAPVEALAARLAASGARIVVASRATLDLLHAAEAALAGSGGGRPGEAAGGAAERLPGDLLCLVIDDEAPEPGGEAVAARHAAGGRDRGGRGAPSPRAAEDADDAGGRFPADLAGRGAPSWPVAHRDPAPAERVRLGALGGRPGGGAASPAGQARRAADPRSLAFLVDDGEAAGASGAGGGLLALTHGALLAAAPPAAGAGAVTRLLLASAASPAGRRALAALAAGERLAVPPPGPLVPAELGAFLVRHGVTDAELPAGLLHRLIEERPGDLAGLRRLTVGDDATIAPARLRERLPAAEVGAPAEAPAVVLDPFLEPVPPGGSGERYVAGDAAGRGAWERPARTADLWRPDPFAGEPGRAAGGRLRRTGTLVRRLRDGRLEAVDPATAGARDGRLDGTAASAAGGMGAPPPAARRVEAALAALPGVAAAVVLARPPAARDAAHAPAAASRASAGGAPAAPPPAADGGRSAAASAPAASVSSAAPPAVTGPRATADGSAAGAAAGAPAGLAAPISAAAPSAAPLAAFVVAADRARPPAGGELRRLLARELPAALVPAELTVLAELPLAADGAVDRTALAALAAGAAPVGGSAPTAAADTVSPLAARLAVLWREVLPVAELADDDDFFALGGHSLLGSRLMARVRESFQVDLPLGSLFRAPTFGALAAEIERAAATLVAAAGGGAEAAADGATVPSVAAAPAPAIGRAERTARRRPGGGDDGRR